MTFRSLVATGILSLLVMAGMLADDTGALNATSERALTLAALPFSPVHGIVTAGSIAPAAGSVRLADVPVINQWRVKMPAHPIIWAASSEQTSHSGLGVVIPVPVTVRMVIILPVPAIS